MSEEKKLDKEAILNDFAALSPKDQRLLATEIVRRLLVRDGWPWLAQVIADEWWCRPTCPPCWPRGGWRWGW